jgi:hypothetical protein
MGLDMGLSLAAVVPAIASLFFIMQPLAVADRADVAAALKATAFLGNLAWFLVAATLNLHSLTYCYIWTRPKIYMQACKKFPLSLFGSNPTHVYAHLAAAYKLTQFSVVFLFANSADPGGWKEIFVSPTAPRQLFAIALLVVGQALNVGIFNAIGYNGVYYGFKRATICMTKLLIADLKIYAHLRLQSESRSAGSMGFPSTSVRASPHGSVGRRNRATSIGPGPWQAFGTRNMLGTN